MFLGPDDQDVAWAVYVAGRMLDGAKLYVDFAEVNPPLIFALNVPIARLSRATGIPDLLAVKLSACALIAVSLGLCVVVLRRIAPARAGVGPDAVLRRGFLALTAFALCTVSATSNVFAQREHVMLMLLLPFLLAAVARAKRRPLSRRLALTVGLLAGVGVALKPYFILPWLLIELDLAARVGAKRAWLRPESMALAGVLVVYAAAVLWLTPAYLALLPVLRQVYGAFRPRSYAAILSNWRAAYVALAWVAAAASQPDETTRTLRRVLLLATAGFAAAMLVQQKGWEYHWYPALASATLLLGLAARDLARGGTPVRRRVGMAVAAVAASALGAKVVKQMRDGLHPPPGADNMRDLTPRATQIVRACAGGGSVAALSGVPMPLFPAVNYTDARWASRFYALWPLSGAYAAQARSRAPLRYHQPGEMSAAERLVYDGVIGDMLRDPPDLLFVLQPPDPELPHPAFDYVTYFSQNAGFADAMRAYVPITRLGPYTVYERGAERRGVRPAGCPPP